MAILLIEDNPTNALVLKRLLQRVCDIDVDVVDNGSDALTLVHSKPYKLLIVDQTVRGGMTGLQFIKAVRMIDRLRALPVLMVTSDQERALKSEADLFGVHSVLYKPIDTSALKQAVRASLMIGDAGPFVRSA